MTHTRSCSLMPLRTKDDDGVIPLGDKLGEERLAIRIEREMMERGYSPAQFNQVCQLLGCPLEKYLQERFFQQLSDHLNLFMYLPKTPFIWHLSTGSHPARKWMTFLPAVMTRNSTTVWARILHHYRSARCSATKCSMPDS